MKTILRNVLIAFILILSTASTLAVAQAPSSSSSSASELPKPQPVDQTNVIFPGCQLRNLIAKDGEKNPVKYDKNGFPEGTGNVTQAGKEGFLKNCVQDIIRFIIVIASLAAILKIAASGLAMLDPSGSRLSQGLTSKATITNLVIGLFLLIVGWNMIPILNASFNNVNFLNIPGTDHCALESSNCTTIYSIQASEAKKALKQYETVIKDKKIIMLKTEFDDAKTALKTYCDNVGKGANNEYDKEYKKIDIAKAENIAICIKGEYIAKFTAAYELGAKELAGKGLDFEKGLESFTIGKVNYKKSATGGKAKKDVESAQKTLIEICQKNVIPLAKVVAPAPAGFAEALKQCENIVDPKKAIAEFEKIASS